MLNFRILAAIAAPLMVTLGLTTATPATAQERTMGEIFMFAGNFCPRGSANTDGQLFAISANAALFSILGTTFGGDGRTTFGLPDLRGRVPMHVGAGPGLSPRTEGQRFGAETHTLTPSEMPSHNHLMRVSNLEADKQRPGNDYLAYPNINDTLPPEERLKIYADVLADNPPIFMEQDAITNTGGNLAHNNIQPSLVIRFCIATQGIYPSRS